MSSISGGVPSRNYIVVFRAGSAAVFGPRDQLKVKVQSGSDQVLLTFSTRLLDKGLNQPIPGDMWIEVQGQAPRLEQAVSRFGRAAANFLSIIAFCTNAAICDMEPELAYDNAPGEVEHDFLQSLLPEEQGINNMGRKISVPQIEAVISKNEHHEEIERIGRAMGLYGLALKNWRWGHETLAIAYLYMGIETITKAVLRRRLLAESQSENELANQLGVDVEKLGPCDRLSTLLEAAVRRTIIFKGDREAYKGAKAASDGLEHGFMPFDEVRGQARNVRDRTAAYLRETILDLLDLDAQNRRALTTHPYDQPLGYWRLVRYVRGKLLGEGTNLSAEGYKHPTLNWRSVIDSIEVDDDGHYQVQMTDSYAPVIAEGVILRFSSREIWAP